MEKSAHIISLHALWDLDDNVGSELCLQEDGFAFAKLQPNI